MLFSRIARRFVGVTMMAGLLGVGSAQAQNCDLDVRVIDIAPITNFSGTQIGQAKLEYSCSCYAARAVAKVNSNFADSYLEALLKIAGINPPTVASLSNGGSVNNVKTDWVSVVNKSVLARGQINRASDGTPFIESTDSVLLPGSLCDLEEPCRASDPIDCPDWPQL